MRKLILELPERFGMTVVVSSHLLSEIDQIAGHGHYPRGGACISGQHGGAHGRSTHHLSCARKTTPPRQGCTRDRGRHDGRLTLPVLTDGETAEAVRALVESRVGVMRLEERQKEP